MSTDIWQLEAAFIERWAGQVPGLDIKTTFDTIDWTDADPLKVCAQVVFDGIELDVGVRDAALVPLRYSAHVFLDAKRQDAADRLLASAVLSGAISAATGWEVHPGRFSMLAGGQRTAFDGRILRVSISFLIPTVALSLL
ncbi:hypothetical protein [Hydrogenophaga sp.]|uniref:hypothetical protein n=1 Tax=Hydrogenophaga sp. TaxID=1904254 RepID=UPI00271FB025|nr:hypothetical protein [Hydrogenophaga sp.]MDO9438558.1 hypothetical protein [Hydrogenophaga sp.]